MSRNPPSEAASRAADQAVAELWQAAEARKCWSCGCLRGTLDAVDQALPAERQPAELAQVVATARQRLAAVRYDCLGCPVCWPANATNALVEAGVLIEAALHACPSAEVAERAGWPPLPGTYTVLRYGAPVAVCTLTSDALAEAVASAGEPGLSLVGTLFTENLGIERLVTNVLANPHVRFLLVCGPDSRQAIGHLPGQSLLALSANGLDERGRILGAAGKRPVLKNVTRAAVEHFRATVTVTDLVGVEDPAVIARAIRDAAGQDPGPAPVFAPERSLQPIAGYVPERMVPDPRGYFVIYLDARRGRLVLEHYAQDGVLDVLIEGRSAAELYIPAVERQLLSRLDHAAYLGRELARAEAALAGGQPYVQDGAPERRRHPTPVPCGCGSTCGDHS